MKKSSLVGSTNSYRGFFEIRYYYTHEVSIEEQEYSGTELRTTYDTSKYEDFEFYTTYEKEFVLNDYDNLAIAVLNKMSENENVIYFALPISSVLVLVITAYLVISIGYSKGKEGIDINDLDKQPLEILIIIVILICIIGCAVFELFGSNGMEKYYKLTLSGLVTAYLVMYTAIAILVTTFIKRVKAKLLLDTTIIGMFMKWVNRVLLKLKNWLDKARSKVKEESSILKSAKKTTTKVILCFVVYILVMVEILIFLGVRENFFLGILIDIAITAWVISKILRKIACFRKIENQLKEIYEGNNPEKLNIEEFTLEFINTVKYINDISNGFENAIQEGIKSERMKTELITNVSHDIKTPLTSIINYVDLLKQENIDNEKANEYIEILETKSHRLKRLIEDLVEASKVSSGNVKLSLERINVGELINQTTGEFKDRFTEKGLELITKVPEKEVFIEADSRYMYRAIENLFSNISKYAATNSRVYIDIITYGDKVNIAIKNVSAERLNISPDELMQRFVRGDKSRTTEGSGLRTFYIA